MKSRKFKNAQVQKAYDLYRNTTGDWSSDTPVAYAGTAMSGAYLRGLLGIKNTNVRTSLAYAAHAAGEDNRADALKFKDFS